MAKILHIKASPMEELSFSSRAAATFLDSYKIIYPSDNIEIFDLWEKKMPEFDFSAASGKYKILRGMQHSEEEAKAWAEVVKIIDQVKSADKYVLSTGMWNFSIPYKLKQFFDVIVQPGLTFSYDPEKGYSGLIVGKPLQLILARGGDYPAGSAMEKMDFQKPYLETILKFIGFTQFRTILIDGSLSAGADNRLTEARMAAAEAARIF